MPSNYLLPYLELRQRFLALKNKYAVLFDSTKAIYLADSTDLTVATQSLERLWQSQSIVNLTIDVTLNCPYDLYARHDLTTDPTVLTNYRLTGAKERFQPLVGFDVALNGEYFLRDSQGQVIYPAPEESRGDTSHTSQNNQYGDLLRGTDYEVLKITPMWRLRDRVSGYLDEDDQLDYFDREIPFRTPKLTKFVEQAWFFISRFELADAVFLAQIADYQDFFFETLKQFVMELQFYPEVLMEV